MKRTFRTAAATLAVATGIALAGCSAGASTADSTDAGGWKPDKTVDLYVGYDTGGSGDSIARELSILLQNDLGVPINVQNRAGASGAEATTELLQQKPDGYSIGIAPASQLTVTPLLSTEALSYQDAEDWTTIGGILDQQNGILVRPESGWKNIDDFVAAAKKDPGKLTVGVPSVSGANAMAVASLMDVAGIDVKIVPFSGGSGESSVALLGGQIDAICATLSGQAGLLAAGQLMSLGHSGDLPYTAGDSTPLSEQGYPITTLANTVYYIYGPPGMPDDVLETWSTTMQKIQDDPKFQEWLTTNGYNAHPSDPADAKQELLDAAGDAQEGVDLLTSAGLDLGGK